MPPRWTAKRQELARRRADGTFKAWPGGRAARQEIEGARLLVGSFLADRF